MAAFFFCFGVVAVSLWQGKMHQRCFTPAGYVDPAVSSDWLCGGMHGCPSSSTCLDISPSVNGTSSVIGVAPMYGLLDYDDLVGTSRVLYTTVQLEGWARALGWLQDAQVCRERRRRAYQPSRASLHSDRCRGSGLGSTSWWSSSLGAFCSSTSSLPT